MNIWLTCINAAQPDLGKHCLELPTERQSRSECLQVSMAMPSGGCDVRLMAKTFAIVATIVMISPAFAAERPVVGSWPGWHSHWSGFWWLCPLMMLFMFAFFALFFVLRGNRGDGRPPWRWMGGQLENQQAYEGYGGAAQESAMDILNKRYARGEIEKDEYEDKKAAIGSAEN